MRIKVFLDKLKCSMGMKKKELKILVVGLNNSGKTSLLKYLKNDDSRIVPTIGFNVEKFKSQSVNFVAYDMSGHGRYRPLWEHYYRDCDAVIFVIDCSDRLRLAVVKDELDLMILHPEIASRTIPLLLLANKKDLRDGMSSVKIASCLQLDRIQNKPWHICSTNSINGEGIFEAIQWLLHTVTEKSK